MGRTIAVIPARGGSKSIPYKNIVNFLDRPLIEHVIESAHRSLEIDEIICSTDSDRIASIVENLGVKVDSRVESLSQDCTPIVDVLKDLTARLDDVDIVPLLQPTSPFILPEHIDACVLSIKEDNSLSSAQTVAQFPHNFHAYNQRVVENGYANFKFLHERKLCYNKQSKPTLYMFGNIVATRKITLDIENDVFGRKSAAVEIQPEYAFDLDTYDDIDYGEFLVSKGKVSLPWL